MKQLLVALYILCTGYSYAQNKCSVNIPADICDFEVKTYTETNFKNTRELKQVMQTFKGLLMRYADAPFLVKEHLLTLGDQILEESYAQRAPKKILAQADGKRNLIRMLKKLRQWEEKNGQIVPLDWQLPKGFVIGVTALLRTYDAGSDKLMFSVSFFSILDTPLELEQFKITRFNGPTVVDKQADIGNYNQGKMDVGGKYYLSASSSLQESPAEDGLYTITIKVKNEKPVEGWFFLHNTATTTPAVLTPQVRERFTTQTPEFRFQDYTSSSLRSSDGRKLSAKVSQEGNEKSLWNTSVINPGNTTSLTMGQEKNQEGAKKLPSGSYRLKLSYEERSYFGGLTVGRVVNTIVPFAIAK